MENKTCAEAARQLRLEEGTVWNRLGRARKLLQQRLTRRGITLSAGILAALLGQNAASAVVPTPLLVSTAQAATLVAAGQAVDVGLVSTKVAALVQGVSKPMFYSKLKIATLLLLAVSVSTTGFGLLKHQILAAQASDQKQVQQPGAVATTPQDKELKDAFADPLPWGAVARLGTTRLRHGNLGWPS